MATLNPAIRMREMFYLPNVYFGIVYIDHEGGHIIIMYACSQNGEERKTEMIFLKVK